MLDQITEGLINRMDTETLEHCLATREIARDIEQLYALDNSYLSEAAMLHGIGKIYLSKEILKKKKELSPFERQIANLYPYYSYEVLRENGVNKNVREIVLYHKGKNPPHLGIIPDCREVIWQYAKTLGTISTYTALTNNREYREAFSPSEAYDIMLAEGNHDEYVMDYIRQQFL